MNAWEQNSNLNFRPAPGQLAMAFGGQTGPAGINSLLVRMLDEIDYGLLLVTVSGGLRYANQLALRSLAGAIGLRLNGGIVSTHRASEQGLLRVALADAGRGLRRLLSLQDDDGITSVSVLPMPGQEEAEPSDPVAEPLVMLVLGKQAASRRLTLDFFARSHRITEAEAKVLQGLCTGLRPKEIAERVGVEISTVRTQIGSLRIKTHTTSIVDLINKVASLPPITPAVKSLICH